MKPDERDPVVERLMEGLAPPQPPPDLRSKVLAAARARMAAEPIPDIWSRVWNHRGLRLAWAATVVLLLAGHAMVVPGAGNTFRPIDPALTAEDRVDDYLVEMLRPTRISDNVQPIVGLFAAAGGLAEIDVEGNPS
jgi:hypothetical protein